MRHTYSLTLEDEYGTCLTVRIVDAFTRAQLERSLHVALDRIVRRLVRAQQFPEHPTGESQPG